MAYVQAKCGKDGRRLVNELYIIAFDRAEDARVRLRALDMLLDRGWNKPSQGIFFSDEMRPLVVDLVSPADVKLRRDAESA